MTHKLSSLVLVMLLSLLLLGACSTAATPADTSIVAPLTLPTRAATPTVTIVSPTLKPTDSPEATEVPTDAPVATPTRPAPTPAVVSSPTPPLALVQSVAQPVAVADGQRYVRGGIDFGDGTQPISLAYPSDLDGEGWVEFDNIGLLISEETQQNFQQFITQFGGKVFVYADLPSGSFVLNVHSGSLRGSGEGLEAEPLRQMIEGKLHNAWPLETVEANLAKLVGRPFLISQGEHTAEFVVSQAARMGYADREVYKDYPGQLSLFLGGLQEPERSFLLIFCSGQQDGEPKETFPGYYVLGLTEKTN